MKFFYNPKSIFLVGGASAAMAFGESIPDKLTEMNKIIETNITSNMFDGKINSVNMQYIDIRLDLFIVGNLIKINAFSRGHYVRKKPWHRIGHRPARDDEEESDKGDGALFLALTVIYCNEKVENIEWIGGVTDWWRKKGGRGGVCAIKDACIKSERTGSGPGTPYEINNDIFLEWSKQKITEYNYKQQAARLAAEVVARLEEAGVARAWRPAEVAERRVAPAAIDAETATLHAEIAELRSQLDLPPPQRATETAIAQAAADEEAALLALHERNQQPMAGTSHDNSQPALGWGLGIM